MLLVAVLVGMGDCAPVDARATWLPHAAPADAIVRDFAAIIWYLAPLCRRWRCAESLGIVIHAGNHGPSTVSGADAWRISRIVVSIHNCKGRAFYG